MTVKLETEKERKDQSTFFKVLSQRLEYRWIGPEPGEAPTIVFLHEGLGCVGMWRDFPDLIVRESGCGALVYSRRGYGASDPVRRPRTVRFMHVEALRVLPAVIEHFDLRDFILFGHSDGASIAIIYAGAHPRSARGLILEAPHVFVEPVCIESIARIAGRPEASTQRTHAGRGSRQNYSHGNAKSLTTEQKGYESTGLRKRLARYHGANTDSMFRTWTKVWLRPDFRQWNIEEYLTGIEAPLLVIQGEEDEYGTLQQADTVVTQVRGHAESLVLASCGHSPHRDQPKQVMSATVQFIRQILNA
ncbi:MAG: alpha/beta fold hydrolase [Terriglobia bacterium]